MTIVQNGINGFKCDRCGTTYSAEDLAEIGVSPSSMRDQMFTPGEVVMTEARLCYEELCTPTTRLPKESSQG